MIDLSGLGLGLDPLPQGGVGHIASEHPGFAGQTQAAEAGFVEIDEQEFTGAVVSQPSSARSADPRCAASDEGGSALEVQFPTHAGLPTLFGGKQTI